MTKINQATVNELGLEYFFFKLPIYKRIQLTEDNWESFFSTTQFGTWTK
jgi:hypothetical protein